MSLSEPVTRHDRVSVGVERFAADWLARREPLDHRSRSHHLTALAARWLAERPGPHGVVDLGSGSGSNLRFLAPRLPGPQRWRLVDHDPALLALSERHAATLKDANGARPAVALDCRDLTPVDSALLAGADLVVASALFDLVSRDWVEALVAVASAHHQALLFTLNVDGDWAFAGPDGQRLEGDEDDEVRALFQAHQCRDKGFGSALGGMAPSVLGEVMKAAGYRVESVATPWQLLAGERELLPLAEQLVVGWHDAALQQAPLQGKRLAEWRDRRLAAIAAGELGVWVGHRDLLALPTSPNGSR